MKIRSVLILSTLSLILLVSFAFAQQEVRPVRFEKISDRLYEIREGGGATGGAYIGDNCVLIIDAKMTQESVDQVIAAVKKMTDKPIKYLVNTHSDGDHVHGNRYFPDTLTFVAHENCRKEFFHEQRAGTPSEWVKPELAPYIPSVTYRDKMDIYLGSKKVELWYFGVGHTTGDTVVFFPEEKTAFLGDQIFIGRPQLIHSYKGGNSFDHVDTLTKMLETIDAERFSSGHSEIVTRGEIMKHIAQMTARQRKVEALVKAGKTLPEVQSEFEEDEAGLVESIYNELKPAGGTW